MGVKPWAKRQSPRVPFLCAAVDLAPGEELWGKSLAQGKGKGVLFHHILVWGGGITQAWVDIPGVSDLSFGMGSDRSCCGTRLPVLYFSRGAGSPASRQ